MTRAVRSRPPRAGDPYGIGPIGTVAAPLLSIVGLLLIGIVTLNLLNGDVPFGIGGSSENGGSGVGPDRTAAPSNVVVVPEEATFEGAIAYAKSGNIWVQTNDDVKQVTSSGGDSMPSWSADGQWIIYIRSTRERGLWPVKGHNGRYDIDVPDLMRVRSDGSAEPERLATGFVKEGRLEWSAWMRQPVLSPDGKTIALITDAPNPGEDQVVLKFFNVETKKLRAAGVRASGVLGHQDPEWRPDGRHLLYVQNGRDGARGAPKIMRYDTRTKKAGTLSAAGYMQPSYSPDLRYVAATRTTVLGTDVVILDARTGRELLRVTDDGGSFAPSWSPAGNGIAFLHIVGQTVDLRLAVLEGAAPAWTVKETVNLTEVSGLDAASRPDWFIPPELLPATPAPTVTPSASAAPVGEQPRPVIAGGRAGKPGVAEVGAASTYLERLGARSRKTGTVLCLGLDPDPETLPAGFGRDLAGLERFAALLLEAAVPYAAAVKPNLAFFEAFGSAGLAALERLRASLPADLPVVADAKRGDIGSTAARQATALFDQLGADAVTVNPYLGAEAVSPLLERIDRFAYVLCRTSNPGAGELQDLDVAADPATDSPRERLHERVARLATNWGPGGTVGLVVGATAPDELVRIRALAPGLAFLVPGVGAQGGAVEPVLEHGPATVGRAGGQPGRGLLVNVSRGIAGAASASGKGDPFERVRAASAEWAARLPVLP